ncbi:uncharacterized protein LOC143301404 [Babylonia areolata]|uniref:uncharacterized protein LOC143301404 n=1 Tax=Babylonia areolata TaxID=304850 RepID=UPI003FCEEC0A
MRWTWFALLLLALIEGGHAAAGDIGSNCDTGDVCTPTGSYCDTTVSSNKLCKCNTGWFQSGITCVRGANSLCHDSQCYTGLNCMNGQCHCDNVTAGYAVGSTGDHTCSCPTNYHLDNGVCKKVVGQACSSASECISTGGMTCADVGGTVKCTCNTNSGYAAGNAGDTSCSCDSNYHLNNGACKKKVGQACSSASECISADGMTCADVGGTDKCTCNTNNNFAAGSAGDTSCSCATNYHLDNGVCKKVVGQTCSAASECLSVTGMTCADVGGTDKCTCNTNNGYAAGSAGATTCSCDTNYHLDNGACKKKVGQACTSASECISTDGMTCADVGGTDKCTCNTGNNFGAGSNGDTSCSCATNYHLDNGVCKKVVGQTCSAASECLSVTGMTCADVGGTDKCTCNTNNGYAAGSAGATTCSCDGNHHLDNGACKKKVGQACSAASECVSVTGMTCASVGGTNKCTCDTNSGYAAGSNGDATCSCDGNHHLDNGACKKKVGQTCTAASECISTDGMTCADVSGTKKCTCNTGSNYAAGSNGDTSCLCASDYTKEGTNCVLRVGKACSSTTAACVFGSICDKKTSTCKCDTTHNFQAGSVGDTSCSCASTARAVTIDGKTYCGNKVGGTCTVKTDANVCLSGTTCKDSDVGGVTVYSCQCNSGTPNADGSCSGAIHIAVSVVVLILGVMLSVLF